ncbi:30S ribosomal protein S2 [Lichenihabitans psoromatis]|uniref:30S ribosomal protein S2 n=1 Tax=Lichenihabitans psoromatis TaxID=2528642 RepID=UPI001036F2A7|nr:30S ribosomal protein S2 [Lichenihabitans psoromatis]
MALPDYTMRSLLEAGAHFGHQSHRWNPKMQQYIFGTRNNIHIIDLAQTVPLFHRALQAVSDTVSRGGRVLFVGTKRQAAEPIADAAKRSAQYYINARWLGGMLTNWKTISASIQRLRKVEELLQAGASGLTKKERLMMSRERDKLEKALGGIKDMGGVPDLIFVIDTNKEQLAIKEANRLGIPVAAIVDTNCDPDGITFPIPGNDDAARAISLYCDLISRAAIDGISRSQGSLGVDIGEMEAPAEEELPVAETSEVAAEASPIEDDQLMQPFELLTAPRGAPDDMSKLHGVGPQVVQKLNDAGVFHYWQLAAMKPEDITKLDHDLKLAGRIERDGWVQQARELMASA